MLDSSEKATEMVGDSGISAVKKEERAKRENLIIMGKYLKAGCN